MNGPLSLSDQPINIEAGGAALAFRAFADVKIRSVGAIPMTTQLAVSGTPGADQNPDILQMIRAGPVGPRDQDLIVGVDVAQLSL